jgi:hypothetical protein
MKPSLYISAAIGFIFMIGSMCVSWQHNPQCEFHCDGAINWANWLLVGSSWFVVVFSIIFLLSFVVRIIYRWVIHVAGV